MDNVGSPKQYSEKSYKAAYAKLGDERVQVVPKDYLGSHSHQNRRRKPVQSNVDVKDIDAYWLARRDESWSAIPTKQVFSRKERKKVTKAIVKEILQYLAPISAFDPRIVWKKQKERIHQQSLLDQQSASKKSLSKADQMKLENQKQKARDLEIAEVTKIRNKKDDLLSLAREVKTKVGRDVLLIEILKKARADNNKMEALDVLWVIEAGELTREAAPKPKNSSDIFKTTRDPSLVYDNIKDVDRLVDEAKKIRTKETDLISFQLNEMYDRLPPLSPYIFDFKLDAWQIRALEFIDAGKSLVICAPTSSGKTVLSSYVAVVNVRSTRDDGEALAPNNNTRTRTVNKEVVEGEEVEIDDDEYEEDDDDDEEFEDDETAVNFAKKSPIVNGLSPARIQADRYARLNFRRINPDGMQRVLFVVPSEPLVWQVAAYFMKLLRDDGLEDSTIAIVTGQMSYYPTKNFGVMPQIVVGTPLALESALTKCRGLIGRFEPANRAQGDLLPGGFDHFDWAIFDEVHALDSHEGDALQRIIRAVNCKFLALSATVGNAEELLGWMERVKGDQLVGVETITVLPSEPSFFGTGVNPPPPAPVVLDPATTANSDKKDKKIVKDVTSESTAALPVSVKIGAVTYPINGLTGLSILLEVKQRLWKAISATDRESDPSYTTLSLDGKILEDDSATLSAIGIKTGAVLSTVVFDVQAVRTIDGNCISIRGVSPQSTLAALRRKMVDDWTNFTADGLQVLHMIPSREALSQSVIDEPLLEGAYSLQLPPGDAIDKGTWLLLGPTDGSGLRELVCVAKPKLEGEKSVHLQQFVTKPFPAGTPCIRCCPRDLLLHSENLLKCGLYSTPGTHPPVLLVRSLVNLLSHQVRFINLQRYLWSNGELKSVNPLAAIESLSHLTSGVLDQSSLSFTSRDSYRLWQEMERSYPAAAVAAYDPRRFFSNDSRITLQQTKEYEDLLKRGMRVLADSHPLETQELLYKFRLEEPTKDIDLCELCYKLRDRNMTPCLAFHLNSFQAIALFKQLLAGIEWRQKRDYPTYYTDLHNEREQKRLNNEKQKKSTGGNEKEAEEKARSGEIEVGTDFSVDPYEPHSSYRFTKASVMTAEEFVELSDEMEKHDGFNKRENMKDFPGQNQEILSHALMRGLRRGIGLYIDEVSSPAYRRAVQKLASLGKLGVVISDDSLAFGVNMPFRTCIFCGEMDGALTPLMAQQMSGRAGRRGLDREGNLVYAGARSTFIRELMIGRVARITGSAYPPNYDTQFLQSMLSPRHVGWARGEVLGGRSLQHFTQGIPPLTENYVLQTSCKALEALGLISRDMETGAWVPAEEWEFLTMTWELRQFLRESVTLGRLALKICDAIERKAMGMIKTRNATAAPADYKANKKADKDKNAIYVPFFYSILLQLVDRTPHKDTSPFPPLQQHALFTDAHPQAKEVFEHFQKLFEVDQSEYPANLSHLRDPVQPGTPLDSTLWHCILDKYVVHTLSEAQKQDIKQRIWHVGTIVKNMHSSLWPCDRYTGVSVDGKVVNAPPIPGCLRTCFVALKYLNSELVRGQINFSDVSSSEVETRSDPKGMARTNQAAPWSDTTDCEPSPPLFAPYCVAVDRVITRMKEWHQVSSAASPAQSSEQLERMVTVFSSLRVDKDLPLLRVLCASPIKDAQLPAALAVCTPAAQSGLHALGVLAWLCLRVLPQGSVKLPLHIKTFVEYEGQQPVDESTVKMWVSLSAEDALATLPEGSNVAIAELEKARTAPGMLALLKWLEASEEGEEEDDDDDDDDEEG